MGTAGCIVTNDSPVSFGSAFAQANGGVFITELAETGVSWVYSFVSFLLLRSGGYD